MNRPWFRYAVRTAAGRGEVVAKVVNCECGATVRAENDDELVKQVEQHVESAHPEMVGTMSREDILGMAKEA